MKKWMQHIALLLLAWVALFPEFIANDDPILLRSEKVWICPACKEWLSDYEYQTQPDDEAVWKPIIPFDERTLEPGGFTLRPPLSKGVKSIHILGTDSQSRDVLSGLIYGLRYAVLIAILSILFAAFVGVVTGLLAAYFGNTHLRLHPLQLLILLIFLPTIGYISVYFSAWLGLLLGLCTLMALKFTSGQQKGTMKMAIPLDQWITKLTDTWDSLPALFVLLACIALGARWDILSLSLLIAAFKWPGFYRISRAELQKYRNSEWIQTLKSLDVPDKQIIMKELAPLLITPLSVHAAFSMASAVSIEATLSFLGLGLSAEVVSWGSLLMEARQHFDAWWLVLFPGICLAVFLLGLNTLAKRFQNRQFNRATP